MSSVETIPVIILLSSLVIELAIYLFLPKSLQLARLTAVLNITIVTFALSILAFENFGLYYLFLAVISLFRLVNLSRVAVARMNPIELSARYSRSAIWLGFGTALVLALLVFEVNVPELVYFVSISLLGSALLFFTCIKSILKKRSKLSENYVLKSVPTVSVCVPARNETQDLPECIESILNSTYPKLEIIVLDDCSHDKTPAIIKQYAHQGVRFIKGQEPKDGWLAKNQAMNKLFDESRGDVVVFCGVDVRMTTDSVQRIVEQLDSGLDMISVLPFRDSSSESSVFIQPIRYWWELSVPRLLGARPPVLSTLWAIKRDKLKKLGDFESFKKSVQPERHFAKRLKNTYEFIISGNRIGITSIKKPTEQFETALRTRYPQVKSRPESVLFLMLAECTVFILPIFSLIYGLINEDPTVTILSAISVVFLVLTNTIISRLTVRKSWLVGLISLPLLIAEDLYILTRSMLAYEFGIVAWKERNICLPMLQVENELPKF